MGDVVTLRGETAHHLLHVLRLKPGAEVTLCDGARMDYTAILRESTGRKLRPVGGNLQPTDSRNFECAFEIIASTPCATEPPMPITVYQAHPKGDKIESIIQKSVELGAAKIIPLYTAHTLAKNIEKKQPRYQKIAHAAAAQCNRGILPEVTMPVRFENAVGTKPSQHLWIAALSPSETGAESLPTLVGLVRSLYAASQSCLNHPALPASLSIWIGPEGGFSRGEVDSLLSVGAHAVSLGPRVLRTETAAPALLAQISLLWESSK